MARRLAIGYTRVSTAEQVNGFGLDVQRQAIKDYCKTNGLRLVSTFSDDGQSGSNGLDTRNGLAEALALVERGDAAVLVVYRLDRLARDLLLQETIMGRMHQAGAEVISVTEPDVDSEDATRVLVRQVLGAIAQYERAVIRGRMAAGKAHKVAQGGYGGGRPRYGYRAENGALVADDGEQAVIARMRQLTAEGASTRAVAEALNAGTVPTKAGGPWSGAQVWAVLQREP